MDKIDRTQEKPTRKKKYLTVTYGCQMNVMRCI